MYEYGITKFGLAQAKSYFEGLQEVFESLAKNPGLGRDASEFIPALHRFSYKAHTIFYMADEEGIFIVRVLNHRMDYKNNL